ncbi:hypothetical protein N7509_004264 [Penicillium cosmopolitanum]|uniref:NACHT domain-containing protein n=1 Tax=Penicillium cosmopolitanum TaxID=1131564 RepID=A0A9W9W705_9EURO|nr:uncharacterized protein N7509_004264 [Penicillium cosmopolitanum]KAJ5404393.1 hypothetical protein N7509_004264 [Penicillium cosmopolitanum]
MPVTMSTPPETDFHSVWQDACEDYARQTGIAIGDERFPRTQGLEDLSRQLEYEKDNFEDFRMKKRPLFHAMQTVLVPFEEWGGLIADGVAVAFPPASSIMGAMLLLVRAARRVSDAFDVILDLFQNLGHFALRLESYKGIAMSSGMKMIIVKVLVNFLKVCAASHNLLNKGSVKARLSKWGKNILVEDSSIKALLDDLQDLTSVEHMMVSAHGLNLTHQALKNTQKLLDRDERKTDGERLERIKSVLEPVPASSQVLSSVIQNRLPGSGCWVEDRLRSWWQGPEPLLWIHGGPGVGKSHLASKIITDLSKESPAPTVACFFFKNNDVDLRSLNKALRTLAWEVATQQPSFAVEVEQFCLKEEPGSNHALWANLFLKYFTQGSSANKTCLIIDGIDEAEPQEQQILFNSLKEAFSEARLEVQPASLRIVLLSRDSVRSLLEEHSLEWVPDIEVGHVQTKDDLHHNSRYQTESRRLVEWANLVIKSVLRCRSKEQIRKVIEKMPQGISAMLQQELQRLAAELFGQDELSDGVVSEGDSPATPIAQLNVLLTFVALAQKPLTIEQLSIILKILLKEEYMGLEDDLRTLYSSLFYVRPSNEPDPLEGEAVVTLRHGSFYEFFLTAGKSGPIHVNLDLADVMFSYVCLHALDESCALLSERSRFALMQYAEEFLPLHLGRSDPEKAGALQADISYLLVDVFSSAKDGEWLITHVHLFECGAYASYPTCWLSNLGRYWLDAGDRATANERADLILNWLLPDAKQKFVSHARSAAMTSDASAFTVLWSFKVVYWTQRWLQPEEINVDDGLSAIVPAILTVYDIMANGSKESIAEEVTSAQEPLEGGIIVKVSDELMNFNMPAGIMVPAERRQVEQTRMWHTRVAQALLARNCSGHAIEHFRIALREDTIGPKFTTLSLYVIQKDMSRAYTKLAMHKEALEHLEISETLRNTFRKVDDRQNDGTTHDRIRDMLHKAQKKHNAKLTDGAIATAEEAWNLLLYTRDTNTDYLIRPFFEIFVELNQFHHLRPVFEFAYSYFKEAAESGTATVFSGFDSFIAHTLTQIPRVMYRVLHCAINQTDQEYIDIATRALAKIDLDVANGSPMEAKYLLSTALVEKGFVESGILGWHDVASRSTGPLDRWDRAAQILSVCKLASLCLEDERPICWKWPQLTLDGSFDFSGISLLLSTWFRNRGDYASARDTLRWCVKGCLSLLTDDDPANDTEAYVGLFKVSLLATDSDADLEAALYMIKHDTEPRMLVFHNSATASIKADSDSQMGIFDELGTLHLTGNKIDSLESDSDDSWIDDIASVGFVSDHLTECSSCKRDISNLYHGWFCRSCPFSALCQRCYRILESDILHPFAGICNPEHQFFFTGSLLRPSERVPEGMVPLISSTGEKQDIWVEEWKDRLTEKWESTEFAFPDDGLLAWCMHALPEPQKTRWATVFKV